MSSPKPLPKKIQLPKILDLPTKLLPIVHELNDYRYVMLEGGRGSGKSHSVARMLLYLSCHYTLRIVCGREIQRSINESVYTLFVDLIREHRLERGYEILSTKITQLTTKTTIQFRGFREQGSVNVKGLEGVDILWVDEAQAITKRTLDIIIPTIRGEKSKIFWTMNRYLFDDPVFKEFNSRRDSLNIHIDYFENKHCPSALKHEAVECKSKNIEDYEHIWLGRPLKQAQNAAFRNVMGIVDHDLLERVEAKKGFDYVMGADLAKSVDYTVLSVLCVQEKRLVYWERLDNENRSSWYHQKEKIKAISHIYNDALVVPDSTGVGDPITEDLQRMGVNVFVDTHDQRPNNKEVAGFKFTSLSKENLVEKLKVAIELQSFRIPYIKVLVDELIRFEATRTAGGRRKYAAPEGTDELGNAIHHDDCVVSLALSLWGTRDMIYQPEYAEKKPKTSTERFWEHVRRDVELRNLQEKGGQMDNIEVSINEDDAVEVI
jgi:PBSX family phage terminase large subunit